MGDAASTRPRLLIRVRDPADAEAWGQFVALYGPLIYQFARKQGLQDADAADLTQIVLQAVLDAMKRLDYDPQRGVYNDGSTAVGISTIQVTGSTIAENDADGGDGNADGDDGQGLGGGLYLASGGTACIDAASVVKKNHASTGNDDIFGVFTTW
jgi:hypothetical protein